MRKAYTHPVIPVLFISIMAFTANAQKLPKIQQTSLRTPANIKIDGKATEWDNKFQALNNATEVYYTIANNDDILYFTVQAKHKDVIDKILRGGITLTINHSIKKADANAILVTYPVLRDADMSSVLNTYIRKTNADANPDKPPVTTSDLNDLVAAKSKYIDIAGIKTLSNGLISVYNQDGIKAVSQFDDQGLYTYELAIPIKYLALPGNGTQAFSYHVKVNELPESHISTGQAPPPVMMTQLGATDFWGEYTLAKK